MAGMPAGETIRLFDRDGKCAQLALPEGEGSPALAVLEGGGVIRIPPALMVRQDSNTYSLAARFDDLPEEERASQDSAQDRVRRPMEGPEMVIPVLAEQARVRRERTVTGKVRLRKIIHHEEQTIDQPILRERVSVERVAIDQWIDTAPPIRSEGETLIVPVVEEVLVVEKRLRLREEVRLTWHHEEEHAPQTLVVRREEVLIERTDDEPGPEDRNAEDRNAEDRGEGGGGGEPGRVGGDRPAT
jgi:uncharacterized protein (TIGR02271 family)